MTEIMNLVVNWRRLERQLSSEHPRTIQTNRALTETMIALRQAADAEIARRERI